MRLYTFIHRQTSPAAPRDYYAQMVMLGFGYGDRGSRSIHPKRLQLYEKVIHRRFPNAPLLQNSYFAADASENKHIPLYSSGRNFASISYSYQKPIADPSSKMIAF